MTSFTGLLSTLMPFALHIVLRSEPPSSLAMRERDQLTMPMDVTESGIVTLVRLLHV